MARRPASQSPSPRAVRSITASPPSVAPPRPPDPGAIPHAGPALTPTPPTSCPPTPTC